LLALGIRAVHVSRIVALRSVGFGDHEPAGILFGLVT